jgi:hypothetical protein
MENRSLTGAELEHRRGVGEPAGALRRNARPAGRSLLSDRKRAKSEAFVDCERRLLSSLAAVIDDVAFEIGVEIGKPVPELFDDSGVGKAAEFTRLRPFDCDGERGTQDRIRNPESGRRERLPERLEKPPWANDPVDDGEVSGSRVAGGSVRDDPHHGRVLLMGFRFPRLDISARDAAEEEV